MTDTIQETVIARAAMLGLSAYEIAKRTEGAVSDDHVRHYLTRSKSMGSHKLQHILRVLGLVVQSAAPFLPPFQSARDKQAEPAAVEPD